MKKLNLVSIACICLIAFGCSPTPRPLVAPFSFQKKLQSVHHWDLLAKDIATQVVDTIKKEHPVISHGIPEQAIEDGGSEQKAYAIQKPGWDRIHVSNIDISPFGRALRPLLMTKLVNHGLKLSNTPKNSMRISWSVVKTTHRSRRIAASVPGAKVFLALLGRGVYKIWDHGSGSTTANIAATSVAFELAETALPAATPIFVPHTEVLITFSLEKNDTIIARQSIPYYINDEDSKHYSNRPDFAGQASQLKLKTFNIINQ